MTVLLVLIGRRVVKELPDQFRQIKWGKKAEKYEILRFEALKIDEIKENENIYSKFKLYISINLTFIVIFHLYFSYLSLSL